MTPLRRIALAESHALRAGLPHNYVTERHRQELAAYWLLTVAHGHPPVTAAPDYRVDATRGHLRPHEYLPDAGERNGKAVA